MLNQRCRAFVAVVDYLYTGKLALTPENAGDVLLAVRVLEMPDQYAECKAFFLKRYDFQNTIGVHKITDIIRLYPLPNSNKGYLSIYVPRFIEMLLEATWN